MGAGASSGLHHDYHDNLYILLRGRKRFRLFPPDHAHRLYTHGAIACIHPNGRIVYKGQVSEGCDFLNAHTNACPRYRQEVALKVKCLDT